MRRDLDGDTVCNPRVPGTGGVSKCYPCLPSTAYNLTRQLRSNGTAGLAWVRRRDFAVQPTASSPQPFQSRSFPWGFPASLRYSIVRQTAHILQYLRQLRDVDVPSGYTPLQTQPYYTVWRFTGSDRIFHECEAWVIDRRKPLDHPHHATITVLFLLDRRRHRADVAHRREEEPQE